MRPGPIVRRGLFFAVVSALLLPGAAVEAIDATLANKVPADAIVYVGWSGAERAGELYDGSHAQALLQASELPIVFERVVPALLDRAGRDNLQFSSWADFLTDINPILYRHPTAIAFGGVDWDAPGQPLPKLLIMVDAGDEAAMLRNEISNLLRKVGKPEIISLMDVRDNVLYLTLGWQKLDLAMAEENATANLAGSERFAAAAQGLLESPMKVAFIDVPGVVDVIREGMKRDDKPEELEKFNTFLDLTGLSGLGNASMASGWSDRLYRTDLFLETRGNRTGLFRVLDGGSLDEQTLQLVPSDSGLVTAARFDPIHLLEGIRNAVMLTNPNAVGDFEQGLSFINTFLGANIERDFLQAAGETWAAYAAPATGDSFLGIVAVNRPDDAAAFRRAMTNLSLSFVSLSNDKLRKDNSEFRLEGRLTETEEGNIYSLDLPMVAPAWAVTDTAATFGLYPQSVAAALTTETGGFADTEAYAAIRELAGGQSVVGFTWVDLPRYSGRGYALLNAYTQFGSGLLSGFGESAGLNIRMPAMTLPPYPVVREHLVPSMTVGWVEENGFHLRSVEPFPGSALLLGGMN